MKLSERGAIVSAISDGGFYLYPAGKLTEIITAGTAGDEMKGDFTPQQTVEKIMSVAGPEGAAASSIFNHDRALLAERLSKMSSEYDIESVFDKMMAALPELAKRYYGIEEFTAPRPKVVEYYFEGVNDLYKDGDWIAFNVDSSESKEMNVPVGTYFKRDHVAPGFCEVATLHEANHVMQEAAAHKEGIHHYIPWFDEGFADIFSKMMLYRATENIDLLLKLKNLSVDISSANPRKVTYLYGEQTAALILLRGRLPFTRALMAARKRAPFDIDWNRFANDVRNGVDPHVAIITSYTGTKKATFQKQIERDEAKFRKEPDLDKMDLRILGMFLPSQAPACLTAELFKACMWVVGAAQKSPTEHFYDPGAVPEDLKGKIAGYSPDVLIPAESMPAEVLEKAPQMNIKIVAKAADIPAELKAAMDTLAMMYFVIRRKIGETEIFDLCGGGLPYRLATGEIRCQY